MMNLIDSLVKHLQQSKSIAQQISIKSALLTLMSPDLGF